MESPIAFPPKAAINDWRDLGFLPIMESVPSNSPASLLLHVPSNTHFNHQEFAKVELSAGKEIPVIQMFADFSKTADDFISRLFTRRSISKALLPLVDRSEVRPDHETKEEADARELRAANVRKAATPYFNELHELLNNTKQFASDTVSHIVRLLGDTESWNRGLYSTEIIHSFCLLFYKLATLDEMHLIKPSLSNDMTNLLSYMNSGLNANTQQYFEIKSWVSQDNSIENELITFSQNIAAEQKGKVFHIIMAQIMDYVSKEKFVVPEHLYAYLRTAIFMVHFYKPEQKASNEIKSFLLNQASIHPLIPLTIEVAQQFTELVRKSGAFSEFSPKPASFDFISLYKEMQQFFMDFPAALGLTKQNETQLSSFYNTVIQGFKLIGKAKNALREQLVMKLLQAPDHPQIKSMYERSLRIGYSKSDIANVLHIITIWRSLHDFYRDNFDEIYALLIKYINSSVQHFVKDTLERVCIHTRKNHELMISIMDPLRDYCGDWQPGEEKGGSQPKTKNLKEHIYVERTAPTPPAVIELLRIQIQHIINDGSELMKSVKSMFGANEVPIHTKDVTKINGFIAESRYFQDVIQFDQLLINLGDQSDLYFKEVQLDINNVVCFPIRSSLPFIICEFALGNRHELVQAAQETKTVVPELCELVFYPLAIYDDAAMRASTQLKSKMLLDEIRNEATICLNTLTTLISEFTFESFRSLATTKFLPPNVYKRIKSNASYGKEWEGIPAYRLSAMLKQNHYYLHGKLLDLRTLITPFVDQNMCKAVSDIINVFVKCGITSSIAIARILDSLVETRRMLCEQGIALMPFDSMITVAIGSSSPYSFGSRVVSSLSQDLTHNVANNFYMRSNPTHLFSTSPISISSSPFGKGMLGVVIRDALAPTFSVLTMEHLCSLVRLIDQGSLSYILHEISKDFEDKFNRFTTLYTEQRPRLQRFRDESLSTPGTLIYDRFEGAYRFFTLDKQIKTVFKAMKALGNLLALASMLDIAITMKQLSHAEIVGYFRGSELDGMSYSDEIMSVLTDGSKAKQTLLGMNDIMNGKEIHPPFLSSLISIIMDGVEKAQTFEETSKQFLCFETLTGFASAWSVLEFVYDILEANRKFGSTTPFQYLGEGVMFFAAAMLCVTDQERLHFATNIGRRIERAKDVDFASASDERLARFCAVYQLESSSLEWAKSVVSPIIKQIRLSQQYE